MYIYVCIHIVHIYIYMYRLAVSNGRRPRHYLLATYRLAITDRRHYLPATPPTVRNPPGNIPAVLGPSCHRVCSIS